MKEEKMKNHPNDFNPASNTIKSGKGYWTSIEQEKFIEAIFLFKKDWKKISEYIKTRTVEQSRSHSQKYFHSLKKKLIDDNISRDNLKKWIKNFVQENIIPIILKFNHYLENYHEKLENFCNLIFRSVRKTKEKKKKNVIKCCCSSKKYCDCGDQCCKISTTEEEDKEIFFDWKNIHDSIIEDNVIANFTKEKEKISMINFTHNNNLNIYEGNDSIVKSENNFLITNKSPKQLKLNMFDEDTVLNDIGDNIFSKKNEKNENTLYIDPPDAYDLNHLNDGYGKINFESIFEYDNDHSIDINDDNTFLL